MSGGRRTHWPRAIVLAAIVLSCLAGSPPTRAGAGGPRPSPGASATRADESAERTRPPGEFGVTSPAAEEESRAGDDIEAEVVIDTTPATLAAAPVAAGARADAALDARAGRSPYLLTAHLRF